MVQGKYLYFGDDLTKAFNIRRKVFVQEQGISEEDEFDDMDDLAIHAIVYDTNENPVATGRVYHDGKNYRIGRIAVLKEERGKYYGDFVVRLLVNKAFMAGAKEVVIYAQVKVIPFYEKIGFFSYGEIFKEDGIDHIKMIAKLSIFCQKCDKK